jgi:hypothetical protein
MAWRWFQLGLINQINVGSNPAPATSVLYLSFEAVVRVTSTIQSAKGDRAAAMPKTPKSVNTHLTLKIEFGSLHRSRNEGTNH